MDIMGGSVVAEAQVAIPDSTMFERRSKQYNGREGLLVEWERAVTGTEHIHSTVISLNIL
jgi:hypothetical protein